VAVQIPIRIEKFTEKSLLYPSGANTERLTIPFRRFEGITFSLSVSSLPR